MTPKMSPGAVRHAFAMALALASVLPAGAQQATTTGGIRGTVTGPDGAPVEGATVVAINAETGVRRGGLADASGRYQISFLDPGTYTFRAQRIGYRAEDKPNFRIAIGQVERVDFQLKPATVQLTTQEIIADATPIIESTKTGTSTRIDQQQIAELPTNGRNFKDLVVLAPGVSDQGNTGSGGGQSIGGGRTGASNILMDGVNNNESFFGGDARGGDRAPFSYSIEAVKEIQVITAGYDVERGSYTGGTVNAVTKSGTNKFTGAVFGYLRQDKVGSLKLTGNDFLGRPPVDFKSQQYGLAIGGPIIKDKAHFFLALDGQRRDQPLFVLGGGDASDAAIRAAGIHPDTVDQIVRSAAALYNYDLSGERGTTITRTDEQAILGKIDWQLSENHKLSVRDNFTHTDVAGDRISTSPTSTDFTSNGGNNKDNGNSLVGSLFSTFKGGFSNEFRAQYATEDKPRPSNPSGQYGIPLPQTIINNIPSLLSNGSTVSTQVRFGSDPVLHANLLNQKTTEIIDNLRWTRNNHTFKAGGSFLNVKVFNRFQNNSLGTFTFNSLLDFQNGNPGAYTRQVALPGRTIPVQDFPANEASGYAQDEWQISPKLFVTYGLRYDYAWYPVTATDNTTLKRTFPYLDTRKQPVDRNNVSPRFGFTFDPLADGTQVIRGGTGFFYGRSPYVLYGNALGATGGGSLFLNCNTAGSVPFPDYEAFGADPSSIPTACTGPAAAQASPAIIVFAEDYQQPRAWKSNLAYDRALFGTWRVTFEEAFTKIDHNYIVQDDNLIETPAFTIEGGIPVFVDASTVSTTNGSVSRANSRRDVNFDQVYVHRSLGQTFSSQSIFQLNGTTRFGRMYASYTYDKTRDNASISCCITGSMFGFARTAGSPNNYNDQWGPAAFTRRHNIVVSPNFHLPYAFQGSMIFKAHSGVPWTPRYGFDINGDGETNDRLYVPKQSELESYEFFGATGDEKARNRSLFERTIEKTKCLREARGTIIGRNGCENRWNYILDARVSRKFSTLRGQNVELQADFFNVLNGINDRWGRRMLVDDDRSSGNDRILIPRGFNTTTRRYIYDVNPTAAVSTPSINFASQQFQMQLGLRYNF